METEKKLAEYVLYGKYQDLPDKPIDVIKTVLLTVLGSLVAGATSDGCKELVDLVKEWGGKQEATILVHGGKVPAYNAALANGTMARAIDYEDAMLPGIHIGPVSIPAALAATELAGGCSGKEFLTTILLATELASRLNQINVVPSYDGFDPTGVCSIFAATAAASRILRLNLNQTLDALGLAFNRCAGSTQSNIDGALSVSFIAGSASASGIICSQLAQRGFTGPKNFLEGPHGYFHLFAREKFDKHEIVSELGERFELINTIFKQYPSCGLTQSSTEGILTLIEEKGITPEDIVGIHVKVRPFAHTVAGNAFEIGDSPRVNAQFSIPYCVANALLRKSSKLHHFDESCVREPKIMEIARKVTVSPDTDKKGRRAMDMEVRTRQGAIYNKSIEFPRGSPENELTHEEHIERFRDCASYGGKPLSKNNINSLINIIYNLEEVGDVRSIIPLLMSQV